VRKSDLRQAKAWLRRGKARQQSDGWIARILANFYIKTKGPVVQLGTTGPDSRCNGPRFGDQGISFLVYLYEHFCGALRALRHFAFAQRTDLAILKPALGIKPQVHTTRLETAPKLLKDKRAPSCFLEGTDCAWLHYPLPPLPISSTEQLIAISIIYRPRMQEIYPLFRSRQKAPLFLGLGNFCFYANTPFSCSVLRPS
jgi:hypothetical protein